MRILILTAVLALGGLAVADEKVDADKEQAAVLAHPAVLELERRLKTEVAQAQKETAFVQAQLAETVRAKALVDDENRKLAALVIALQGNPAKPGAALTMPKMAATQPTELVRLRDENSELKRRIESMRAELARLKAKP